MVAGLPVEVSSLTKRFGAVRAVDNLTFTVAPGRVTGFLGPNGAGKTTTLRILLGLVAPSSGTATFGGKNYASLKHPMATVGAALEASSFHPGRSARNHLVGYAISAGLERARVDAVLELVGLAAYAHRRVGGFSLGMRQRLGLAFTLMGDPGVLILDEPVNGLDPEGIRWIRNLLSHLASEGRTVLVSSHVLSEVAQSVDDLVVIARGQLRYNGPLEALAARASTAAIADSPQREQLSAALRSAGLSVTVGPRGIHVDGATAARVGHIAFTAGVELSLLEEASESLEDAFLALVQDASPVAFTSPAAGPAEAGAAL